MDITSEKSIIHWFKSRFYYLPEGHPSPFTKLEVGDHFLVDINRCSFDINHDMLLNNKKWLTVERVENCHVYGLYNTEAALINGSFYSWYHMADYIKRSNDIEKPGIPL